MSQEIHFGQKSNEFLYTDLEISTHMSMH